jgi:hypothetical protein
VPVSSYSGLVAGGDRLPVVIMEATCHTRRKPGLAQRAAEMVQTHFEIAIHASAGLMQDRRLTFAGSTRMLCAKRVTDVARDDDNVWRLGRRPPILK